MMPQQILTHQETHLWNLIWTYPNFIRTAQCQLMGNFGM